MRLTKNPNKRPHNWLIHHYLEKSLKANFGHIRGCILDIGCGSKPYRNILKNVVDTYIGLDCKIKSYHIQKVDVVGDALNIPFQSNSFDSIVSFQVMEHVPEPKQFLKEAIRVVKPGGVVYLSTPFMWGLHEEPHDYYRFTEHGLKYLAEKSGFEVISIEPDTGYWSTAVLRFNYAMNRLAKGPIKFLLMPLWLNQFLALWLDKLDRSYSIDTATYTTLLRRPG